MATDTFTGTNGDSWDSTNWPTQTVDPNNSSGTIEIQSNQGRMSTPAVTGAYVSAVGGTTAAADQEVELTVTPTPGSSSNEWLYVCLRSSGEVQDSADGRPATAYYYRAKTDSNSYETNDDIYRRVGNSETKLVDITALTGDRVPGDPFKLKLKVEDDGSDVIISWKLWDAGNTEPGTWETHTDSSPSTLLGASGKVQLVTRNYNTSSGADIRVDDLTFDVVGGSGGAQTIAVGQASETDTAQAVTADKPQFVSVGQASESDAAQAVTPVGVNVVVVGQAVETDTALSVATQAPQSVVVGQATETARGQAITWNRAVAVLQAEETGAAHGLTAVKPIYLAVRQAVEADEALGVTTNFVAAPPALGPGLTRIGIAYRLGERVVFTYSLQTVSVVGYDEDEGWEQVSNVLRTNAANVYTFKTWIEQQVKNRAALDPETIKAELDDLVNNL